jgi:hypothetical protein
MLRLGDASAINEHAQHPLCEICRMRIRRGVCFKSDRVPSAWRVIGTEARDSSQMPTVAKVSQAVRLTSRSRVLSRSRHAFFVIFFVVFSGSREASDVVYFGSAFGLAELENRGGH